MGKRITREELDEILGKNSPWEEIDAELWSRIQEAQSSEPMSLNDIDKFLSDAGVEWVEFETKLDGKKPGLRPLSQLIQPLTVQQGFVPDWSKAGAGVRGYVCRWWYKDTFSSIDAGEFFFQRPAPKTRQKTREERVNSIINTMGGDLASYALTSKLSDSTIDDLCRAAGIPLETTE